MQSQRSRLALPVLVLLATASSAHAGPLNPPAGPITSTSKPISEVEPRTAINATNTPGDANSVYRITQPGSYYLTGNFTGVAGKSGIEIAASPVSIDLGGFTITGVASSINGITTDGIQFETSISNGTVQSWGHSGINLSPTNAGEGARVKDVIVNANLTYGMKLPSLSVVTNCQALNTLGTGGAGIQVGTNSTVSGCAVHANNGYGIFASGGASIVNCVVATSGSTGIYCQANSVVESCTAKQNTLHGIWGFDNCVIRGSTASANGGDGIYASQGDCTVVDCTTNSNTANGIYVIGSSMVSSCLSNTNGLAGIRVGSHCSILNNNCAANGQDAAGDAGIHVIGSRNRIEGNNCTNADFGIQVDNSPNIIVRNTCNSNTTNWQVIAGNRCLVVQGVLAGAISGNAGGVSPGSTDPNANFTY